MRVGLNLLHALPEIGGGWHYINNLLQVLARATDRSEFVAYVTSASASLVPQQQNFRQVRVPIRSQVRAQRILFENTVLQALVVRDRLDCLHWFANGHGVFNAAPPVVTVYDLQPFLEQGQLAWAKRRFLRWRLRASIRSAATLLPMSQTTADALHELLGADRQRMTVIPPPLEPLFAPVETSAIEAWRAARQLPRDFWLFVAHAYPHKNHERLLQAYRAYLSATSDPWALVLRGDPQPGGPDLAALARQLEITNHVIFLPSLPHEELPILYNAASALLFPSLYEGAGLPVLEALACGCPVVASSIPAVREFGGEAVRYFDAHDARGIAEAMSEIAADTVARLAMREQGLVQAQKFRHVPIGARLIEAYERAAKHQPLTNHSHT